MLLYARRDGVQRPVCRYLPLPAQSLAFRGVRAPAKILVALLTRLADHDGTVSDLPARLLGAQIGMSPDAVERARTHLARAGLIGLLPGDPRRQRGVPACRLSREYRLPLAAGPIVPLPAALILCHPPEVALLVSFVAWKNGDLGPRPLALPELAVALGVARSSVTDTVARAVQAGLLGRHDGPGGRTAYAVLDAPWLHTVGALRECMRPLAAPIPPWLVDDGDIADDLDDATRGLSQDLPPAPPLSPSLSRAG
ncbi:MAG: MarR family transcriptional regulator [Deltaproteobacteria bacterium]|nr:MarR family transcriptional regulator [Deltaproteobacteria bacterium]